MNSYRDILSKWQIADLAADLGITYVSAQVIKHRGSIHPRHWTRLVEGAQRRGYLEITERLLAEIAAREDGKPRPNGGQSHVAA